MEALYNAAIENDLEKVRSIIGSDELKHGDVTEVLRSYVHFSNTELDTMINWEIFKLLFVTEGYKYAYSSNFLRDISAYNPPFKIVKMLLNAGAPFSPEIIKNLVLSKNLDTINLLIERGADLNVLKAENLEYLLEVEESNEDDEKFVAIILKNVNDKTVLSPFLKESIDNNNISLVRMLVESGVVSQINYDTLDTSNLELVKIIAKMPGTDPTKFLTAAVLQRDLDFVRELLEDGAKPNIESVSSTVDSQDADMLTLLLDFKEPNTELVTDEMVKSAVELDNSQILSILLENGGQVKNSYLLLSVENSDHATVIDVLLQNGADINYKNGKILCKALLMCKINIIRYLVWEGISKDYVYLHYGRRCPQGLEILLEMGYTKDLDLLFEKACEAFQNFIIIAEPSTERRVLNLCLPLVNRTAKNKGLVIAASNGSTELAEILLANGAEINYNQGEVLRVSIDYPEMQEFLISRGAVDGLENGRRERIERARDQERKNEERRNEAVTEHKNSSATSASKTSSGSQSHPPVGSSTKRSACSNPENLYGDPVNEDEIIVFLIEGKTTGECLSKEEISRILESSEEMALWDGPPSGTILSQGIPPGRRRENSSVYKLPWSGVWVEENVLQNAMESKEKSTIILEGQPASIGSSFGISQLHGQWGGEWGYIMRENDQVAVRVETKDFRPDERYMVYRVKEII